MPEEGLQQADVEGIRQSVDRAIEAAVSDLRKIESASQGMLHAATVEQQQLCRGSPSAGHHKVCDSACAETCLCTGSSCVVASSALFHHKS